MYVCTLALDPHGLYHLLNFTAQTFTVSFEVWWLPLLMEYSEYEYVHVRYVHVRYVHVRYVHVQYIS
jgi:hypothetical protein